MTTIVQESAVMLHFTIKLKDGSVADSTHNMGKPAKLVIGDGIEIDAVSDPEIEAGGRLDPLQGAQTADHATQTVELMLAGRAARQVLFHLAMAPLVELTVQVGGEGLDGDVVSPWAHGRISGFTTTSR